MDVRRVNAVTQKDAHPMPRVDDILDQFGGAKYFTTLDLDSGYWQVPLREEDAAWSDECSNNIPAYDVSYTPRLRGLFRVH